MAPNNRDLDAPVEGAESWEMQKPFNPEYIPKHVFLCVYIHVSALYGIYLAWNYAKWSTLVFESFLYVGAVLGITAGAHRLWSHRSYKAKPPLQLLLVTLTSLAFQFSSITWVRDHRSHHKFSDTHADPHNSNRGLFYSHIGWLLMNKHPDVKRKGRGIDLTDVYNNPLLRFQHENFLICGGLAAFVLPTLVPLLWGESLNTAWHICLLRYVLSMHSILLINSAAHKWGNKPYDTNMAATQNTAVSIINLGEGYHNYHHAFPYDYRASEWGEYFNLTTHFINFFVWIGWAYDLRVATADMIKTRSERTGDGTPIVNKDYRFDCSN